MATTYSITATSQAISTNRTRGAVTVYNDGTNDVYYRRNDFWANGNTDPFTGNAAQLAAIGEGVLRPGDTVTLQGDWLSIDAVCATGGTATLRTWGGSITSLSPTRDHFVGIAEGHYGNHFPLHVFGTNPLVNNVREDMWEQGGVYVFPAAAGIRMELVSTSVEDDILTGGAVAGTGIHTIEIHYLDDNLDEQVEVLNMDGQTAAPTTAVNIRRVQSIHARATGTGGAAAGTITLQSVGGGVIYSRISLGETTSQQAIWTVPNGAEAYITAWCFGIGHPNGNRFGRFGLQANADPITGALTSIFQTHAIGSTQDGFGVGPMSVPLRFLAGVDIKITVLGDAGSANAITTGCFQGWYEI